MTLAMLISALIGVVIPLFNGLITRYSAVRVRVYLQIVLSAANGFLVQWITAGDTFNVNAALYASILSLITALSVEAKVWAPLGVSEALKRVGSSGAARPVAFGGGSRD